MIGEFKIIPHRNSENLHLQLKGEFDDIAAMELIHVLNDNRDRYGKIFVHTSGLTKIYSQAESVFMKNCPAAEEQGSQLIFSGQYSEIIAPQYSVPAPNFYLETPTMRGWF